MYNYKSVLFIQALTSLHPGSGSALGAIDLPIQRERHTGWPVIPASSIKGVLRSEIAASEHSELVVPIFGPDTSNAADHAGALVLTDARILFFPVRSMKGVFALVTCPAVLNRFVSDLKMAGITKYSDDILAATRRQPAAMAGSPIAVGEGNARKALLEDNEVSIGFELKTGPFSELLGLSEYLLKRIVVVSDDTFTHFVRYCTEVTTRIKLDSSTKTVVDGALFNQELLPPETVFYSVSLLANSRKDGKDAKELGKVLCWLSDQVVQIGGDETTGKGFCRLAHKKAEEARK